MKSTLRYLVFLAIGIALFWLASGTVEDPEALWADMRKVSWQGIVASVLMGYAAIVSRGLRWQLLLRPIGVKVATARGIHAVAFGYFANTFVPRSGELARCAALNQTDGAAVDKLFGTVISERVIDLVMLLLFTGLAVIFNLQAFRDFSASFVLPEFGSGTVGLLVTVVLAALYALWSQRRRLAAWPPVARIFTFLSGIGDGLLSIKKMERKWAFIAHTIFIWNMYFWMAMVIFWSIDDLTEMAPAQALFIVVAGGFGMVIPAPGGIGSYHYAVQLAFIALGFSGQLGLATANVVWATQTGMIVLSGGLGYLALMAAGLRKKSRT